MHDSVFCILITYDAVFLRFSDPRLTELTHTMGPYFVCQNMEVLNWTGKDTYIFFIRSYLKLLSINMNQNCTQDYFDSMVYTLQCYVNLQTVTWLPY